MAIEYVSEVGISRFLVRTGKFINGMGDTIYVVELKSMLNGLATQFTFTSRDVAEQKVFSLVEVLRD